MKEIIRKTISAKELRHKKLSSKLILLDVRDAEEYAGQHIPGSIHIPATEISFRLKELNEQAEIIVYCNHGNRSSQVANFLLYKGYDTYILAGGMESWLGIK